MPSISHRPKKTPNYSLSKRIINEQLDLLDSLKAPPPRNLSKNELEALKELKTNPDIIIKPADKNLGITVLSTTIYNELCMKHINENDCYQLLDHNPIELTNKKLITMIHHLHDNRLINMDQHNALLPSKEHRLGIFYGLPKLHKDKLSIRPIISQISHPTRNMSKFLHETLLSTATNASTYIKNSYDLVDSIKNINYNPDLILITCDIVSLYTNIPTKEGIKLTTQAYLDFNVHNKERLDAIALETLLNNTLVNNVFQYNLDFYRQTNGTAMGTIMAPTYANCYLSYKERLVTNNKNIILFKRYIDDILIIFNNSDNSLKSLLKDLQESYSPLELTMETSNKSAVFLDTTISLNHTEKSIESSIYYKPIGNTNPIHMESDHPDHMKRNTLTGNALRINRLCTNKLEAYKERIILQAKYLKHNYPALTTIKAIKKANHHHPKEKSLESSNSTRLKFTYNQYTHEIKQSYYDKWREFESPLTEKFSFAIQLNKSLKESLVKTKALALPKKEEVVISTSNEDH